MQTPVILEVLGCGLVVLRLLAMLQRLRQRAWPFQPAVVDPLAAAFQQDLKRRGLLPHDLGEAG